MNVPVDKTEDGENFSRRAFLKDVGIVAGLTLASLPHVARAESTGDAEKDSKTRKKNGLPADSTPSSSKEGAVRKAETGSGTKILATVGAATGGALALTRLAQLHARHAPATLDTLKLRTKALGKRFGLTALRPPYDLYLEALRSPALSSLLSFRDLQMHFMKNGGQTPPSPRRRVASETIEKMEAQPSFKKAMLSSLIFSAPPIRSFAACAIADYLSTEPEDFDKIAKAFIQAYRVDSDFEDFSPGNMRLNRKTDVKGFHMIIVGLAQDCRRFHDTLKNAVEEKDKAGDLAQVALYHSERLPKLTESK